MATDTQLYILGAGCSVGAGYPVAAGMVSALKTFREKLGEDAQRVRGCVERTAELMERLRVSTIDDLAHRLHHGRGDDAEVSSVEARRQRIHRMKEAKIAVSAFFEALESSAAATGLPAYHDFLHRLFPPHSGRFYQQQLAATSARVFSFNYDRLFEIAFCQHFKTDSRFAFYGLDGVNSGVNAFHNEDLSFRDDSFSFLKLHGSVGMFADEDVFGLQITHTEPSEAGSAAIRDETYFRTDEKGTVAPAWCLIFFPHEKQYLLSDDETGFPYRKYAKQVWQRAELIAESSSNVWVIGYSFCETDFPFVLRVLRAAKDCKSIVIQGPNPTAIAEKLRIRAPDLRPKIEEYRQAF